MKNLENHILIGHKRMTYFYHQSELIVWKKITKKLNLVRGLLSMKQQSLCRKFQSLGIIYLGYQSRIFGSSTKKIRSFRRFKNFRCFQILVPSYRANSKRQKRRKITSMVEY